MFLIAKNLIYEAGRNFHKAARLPPLKNLVAKINENNISEKYAQALQNFEGKIYFNSVLEIQRVRLKQYNTIIKKKERYTERQKSSQQVEPLPLVLNQLCDGPAVRDMINKPEEENKKTPTINKNSSLPYTCFIKVKSSEDETNKTQKEDDPYPKNWMSEYELYDESEPETQSAYGTPNPLIPTSTVPCGGCGALLHCKEPSIPGYIPSEIFIKLNIDELGSLHCQRCHFLINYNTAINVTVAPEDYINIISTIKDKYALAVVLVDLLDFPCSIFSGLSEILGPNRPIFIVGNKVDLLPRDNPKYLTHIKNCLMEEAMKMGFAEKYIKHISLISAKTGYGVEDLITKLHTIWNYKGDVYLIGCTNVGKSSLFNALLRSDYCKVNAIDLVQRATACPWPGTTLRMLKFPILKTSDYRLHLRTVRLIAQQKKDKLERELRKEKAKTTKSVEHATLIGHIGMTFKEEKEPVMDPSGFSQSSGFNDNIFTLNEKDEKYAYGKWCFDTPGVVQKDQILHLLTTDEIMKVLPKEMLRPRAFLLKRGLSLFLAGLGRLDFVDGPEDTRVIVYSSLELPVSICEISDADEFYNSFLGSEILGVPINSGEERLAKWPKLEAAYDKIVVEGVEKHITVCDIIMSSAGWIGITLPRGVSAVFKAWTPEKRGIHVRNPSILPNGLSLRGKRVRRSFAYLIGEPFSTKNM